MASWGQHYSCRARIAPAAARSPASFGGLSLHNRDHQLLRSHPPPFSLPHSGESRRVRLPPIGLGDDRRTLGAEVPAAATGILGQQLNCLHFVDDDEQVGRGRSAGSGGAGGRLRHVPQ